MRDYSVTHINTNRSTSSSSFNQVYEPRIFVTPEDYKLGMKAVKKIVDIPTGLRRLGDGSITTHAESMTTQAGQRVSSPISIGGQSPSSESSNKSGGSSLPGALPLEFCKEIPLKLSREEQHCVVDLEERAAKLNLSTDDVPSISLSESATELLHDALQEVDTADISISAAIPGSGVHVTGIEGSTVANVEFVETYPGDVQVVTQRKTVDLTPELTTKIAGNMSEEDGNKFLALWGPGTPSQNSSAPEGEIKVTMKWGGDVTHADVTQSDPALPDDLPDSSPVTTSPEDSKATPGKQPPAAGAETAKSPKKSGATPGKEPPAAGGDTAQSPKKSGATPGKEPPAAGGDTAQSSEESDATPEQRDLSKAPPPVQGPSMEASRLSAINKQLAVAVPPPLKKADSSDSFDDIDEEPLS